MDVEVDTQAETAGWAHADGHGRGDLAAVDVYLLGAGDGLERGQEARGVAGGEELLGVGGAAGAAHLLGVRYHTFRPDEDAGRALAELTRDGTSVSAAVRGPSSLPPEPARKPALAPKPWRWPMMRKIVRRQPKFSEIWRHCVRGEVFRLRSARDADGDEQASTRFAVVVQSDLLPLSTWLVAPTSTSARPATFRPEVEIGGRTTRVLARADSSRRPTALWRERR